MDFDFRLARASDFSGIREIFTHYATNTSMAPAHDIPSTLSRLQQNLGFPDIANDNDDETQAYPNHLPTPVVIARQIMLDGSKAPKVVGYVYLGPTDRLTDDRLSKMEMFLFVHPEYVRRGIGGALLAMLLTLVHSPVGVRCYDWMLVGEHNSVEYMVGSGHTCRIVTAVAFNPEAEDGEWLLEWLRTKGFVEYNRVRVIRADPGHTYVFLSFMPASADVLLGFRLSISSTMSWIGLTAVTAILLLKMATMKRSTAAVVAIPTVPSSVSWGRHQPEVASPDIYLQQYISG